MHLLKIKGHPSHACDIDDVIANTFGYIVAWEIFNHGHLFNVSKENLGPDCGRNRNFRAIRKNAVKVCSFIVSACPELFDDPERSSYRATSLI